MTGLTAAEVRDRVSDGRINIVDSRVSRSVGSILSENLLTRFNAIMSVMLVIVLVFGHLPDALFGFVMVANAVIGIVQELRAKRTLDKLSVLVEPNVTVVRDGTDEEIPTDQIVLDDVIRLVTGDQVPADGIVLIAGSVQVDESLLTGEADPVHKEIGDSILSGSFIVAGSTTVEITAVGDDAYAQHLAAEAKEFTLAKSELMAGIDQILRIVTWLLIPIGGLLLWSQLRTDASLGGAMVSTVAGVVGMVPQGLVLLVSMAMAVAVIRLGKRRALVQELPAVETLARVDIVCVDKTGTLTTGLIRHRDTVALEGHDPDRFAEALAALAVADPHPNPTMSGIAEAYPNDPGWTVDRFVPFSSAKKFSAARFTNGRTWVIGAPEIVLADRCPELLARLNAVAATGDRVLLVAVTDEPLPGDENDLPMSLEPIGFLTFAEEIRSDAAETVGYFVGQHVTPKVISGDSASTVGAIAATVGIPNADRTVDARTLPDSQDVGFGNAINDDAVFGRVTPDQKRSMVTALQSAGHTVAMTGDGVNDVLALKRADIGIAMGAGAPATRSVAQIVLLDNEFSALPFVVAEGRRVIANMERVASLFVTKTVYAAILAVAIGFVGWAFPLLPRHLTLIGSLTIGIPAFFLSFESTEEPVRPGAFQRIMRFAVPSGVIAAGAAYGVYSATRAIHDDLTVARSATTITMVLVGTWILVELISPLTPKRAALIGSLVIAFVLILALPLGRDFFDLVIPPLSVIGVIGAISLAAAIAVHVMLRVVDHHGGQWVPWLRIDEEET
ncbi:MAG: HAD-IC family P-type ATPase [Actinomycetota bacterium]|nr:HAD-IC family P-type ATPase [Actinomycetota bacterium]